VDFVSDVQPLRGALEYGLSRVCHRGPEGTDSYVSDDFLAGHAHLTFHEPGRSDQPYVSDCGRYVVLLNGELYNYSELRSELLRRGIECDTRSEGELILRLYRLFGDSFVELIRGMFAIAIRDRERNCLVLARDFIGKKPLYYVDNGPGIAFASELTALKPFLPRASLDPAAFTSFFLMNGVDSGMALLADARKVRPGEIVTIDPSGTRRRLFWSVNEARPATPRNEVQPRLAEALDRAVARRLPNPGVKLGLMLSGGLDSSMVAALAARQGQRLPSFSARIGDSGFDESRKAASVARLFCSSHDIIDISDAALPDAVSRYFGSVDEPVADPSFVAIALVTEAAKATCKGMLTGDGADDVFAGYAFFRAVRALDFASRHLPPRLLLRAEKLAARLPGSDRNLSLRSILHLLSRGARVPPEWQHAFSTSGLVPGELREMLRPEARHLCRWDADLPSAPSGSVLQRARAGLIRSFLQGRILTKLDRAGMINGMELRCPFLDQDVVELALSIDPADLVRGKETKLALRRFAQDILPPEILKQKKKGFSLPTRRLLRGPLRPLMLDMLSPERLKRQGIFDPAAVGALTHQHLAMGLDRSKPLWALLAFNLWEESFQKSSVPCAGATCH